MKPAVVFLLDCIYREEFFSRIAPSFQKAGYCTPMITNRYSAYRRARQKGFKVYLPSDAPPKSDLHYNILETLDLKAGYLSEASGHKLASSMSAAMDQIALEYNVQLLIIWNGTRCAARGMEAWAKANTVKTLFLEIGNFPGKLFADTKGCNALSELASDSSILDKFPLDENAYEAWKHAYLGSKLNNHHVPQGKWAKHINYEYAWDLLGYKMRGIPPSSTAPLLPQIKSKLLAKRFDIDYDTIPKPAQPYLFYPMQVANDSQLLLFSSINNIDAIKQAHRIAASKNLKLYVKPHPGEVNVSLINRLYKLRKELGFLLVNGNTFEFLRDTEEVVTINSTVGLEARILGTPTTVLAEAFYTRLSDQQIKKYIQHYLLDIEFFTDEPLSPKQTNALLTRAGLQGQNNL